MAAKVLSSYGKDFSTNEFLRALAEREESNRNGKLNVSRVRVQIRKWITGWRTKTMTFKNYQSIIFIRTKNGKNQEISGYIDYSQRLTTDNFDAIFNGTKTLIPKPSDLSFYNWETQTCTSNASPNFQVIADNETGLLFKNKRDRKIINVDPKSSPGDNTTRSPVSSPDHIQVVIYDHFTRRKAQFEC